MTIIWELAPLIAESFPRHRAELREVLSDFSANPAAPVSETLGAPDGKWGETSLLNYSSGPAHSVAFPRVSSCCNRVSADENKHSSAVSVCCGTPERDTAFPADIWAGRSKNKPWLKIQLDKDSADVVLAATGDMEMQKGQQVHGGRQEWWYLTGLGCPLERFWSHQGQPLVGNQINKTPADEAIILNSNSGIY